MNAYVYYSPEKFGLTPYFEVDKSSGSYEFDLFVVWQTEQGDYVWAFDSGCSCPVPFEDVDLSDLARGSLTDAYVDAIAWLGPEPRYYIDYWKDAERKILDKFQQN